MQNNDDCQEFSFLDKNLSDKIKAYIKRNDPDEIAKNSKKIATAREETDKAFFSSVGTDKRILEINLTADDLKTKTFATFEKSNDTKHYFDRFTKWTPDANFGIFFYGSYGTGKTHLMKALLLKWHSENFRCYFLSANTLFEQLREENSKDYQNKLLLPNLLAIDDLGTEYHTEYTAQKFLKFLDYRKNSRGKKLTCISTNLSMDELTKMYDKRALDRLKEQMVFIESRGKTFRDRFYFNNLKKWENLT